MSVVTVNTETLETGGSNVIRHYNENKECYDAVSGTSISSCASFDTFKGSLKSLFGTYTSHCNIMNEKLTECAAALVETDSSIAGNFSGYLEPLNSQKVTSSSTTTATVSNEYVNPYDPDNLPNITLYDSNGVLAFEQNGSKVYESFCNTCLKHSLDLKFLILKMGYDAGFWYREDGVQMWGEDVMYGGAIPKWGKKSIEQDDEIYNPAHSTRRRGDKFYGTSGPGRIVGYGGTSTDAALGGFDKNGVKYDETYDTYTAWKIDEYSGNYDVEEYQKYSKLYYGKDEAHATRNVINNQPLDPSERYYQTNEEWVDLFRRYPLTRDYIPEGVVDWKTNEWRTFDWESYFQQNNPDRITS